MEIHQFRPADIHPRGDYKFVGEDMIAESDTGLFTKGVETCSVIVVHDNTAELGWMGHFRTPLTENKTFDDLSEVISSHPEPKGLSAWVAGVTTIKPTDIFTDSDTSYNPDALRIFNEEMVPETRELLLSRLGQLGIANTDIQTRWLHNSQTIEIATFEPIRGILRYAVSNI